MLRFSELGLFLVPFGLFVVWRVMGPRTPPAALWTAAALLVLMAAGTVWYGLERRMPADEAYAPAQLVDGKIVPGHAVPRASP